MSERIDDIIQKMKKNKDLEKRRTELILKEIQENQKEYENRKRKSLKEKKEYEN